jgi:hypothetical protein
MRFVAAIGLAVLAVGCTPKLEFVDGYANTRPTATHLAEADEMEAAAAAQTERPAIRNTRSLPLRAQGAGDEGKVHAQNNPAVAAVSRQPNVVTPAAAVVSSEAMPRDRQVATQAARVDAADRAPVQALDAAPEIALSPARETAPIPTREISPSPAREAAVSAARETALSPAREMASIPTREISLSPARETSPSAARETALVPARETAPIPTQEISLSPAREAAVSAARETALSPAQETAPSPVREAGLSPAREKALIPGRETGSNEGSVRASACIRNNMKAAYRSSDTVDQATAFLMRTCFAPFSSAIASDETSARTLFRSLVLQEINPVEWLEALQGGGGAAQGR